MPPDIKFIGLTFSVCCSWPRITMTVANYESTLPTAQPLLGCFNCWSVIVLKDRRSEREEGQCYAHGRFLPSSCWSVLHWWVSSAPVNPPLFSTVWETWCCRAPGALRFLVHPLKYKQRGEVLPLCLLFCHCVLRLMLCSFFQALWDRWMESTV